jgi:hypothetical protein
MQALAAIAFSALLLGISYVYGDPHRHVAFPLWFFVPSVLTAAAGLGVSFVVGRMRVPWAGGELGLAPRRVHLSWRSALRLPVFLPVALIPWNMLSILRLHFTLDWVVTCLAVLAAGGGALLAMRLRRDIALLREGSVVFGVVQGRERTETWTHRIAYSFTTARGEVLEGRAWDLGYELEAGDSVPVYYDPAHPRRHRVACASWFEAGIPELPGKGIEERAPAGRVRANRPGTGARGQDTPS